MEHLKAGVHQIVYTLLAFPRAWRFMWHHRLWEGLRNYGWVAKGLVIIAVAVGIYMIAEVVDFLNNHNNDAVQALFMSSDSLFITFFEDLYDSLSDGAMKWVILVLLEVVIYHFMRRSLAIILNKQVENAHTFKPFLEAQKRMIVVSFFALVFEGLVLNVGETFLPGFINVLFSILVSSAFLGFVIADNYNEQFGLTIEQSRRHVWRRYIGISIGLGLPLFFMLKVPLIGAVIGPLVTSVTAAIVLRELSDLHLVGYQMNEKERAKFEKKEAKRRRKEERKLARKTRRLT